MEHRSARSNGSKQRSLLIAFSALLLVGLLAWSAPMTRANSEARTYLPAIMQHLANYTEVPNPHPTTTATVMPTLSATATSTATPTPTMTPTMTPPTLTPTMTATETPVLSCSSIYPIAVDISLIDVANGGFIPPSDPAELPYFGLYSDATYSNKTQRRIYLTGIGSAGFGFARWRADTPADSVPALVASLSGTGNIAQGFDEAPWPAVVPGKPNGYPIRPGSLGANDDDWSYASTASMSSDVLTALQAHVINKTVMTLPINDQIAGSGSNLSYHIQTLADFLLRGYGNQPSKSWYLDLVYVGLSSAAQCE